MSSDIKVGQRFTFKIVSSVPFEERQAVVTRLLSNREEGLGPEINSYIERWVEAREIPEVPGSPPLVFSRGTDGSIYLDGSIVTVTPQP